METPRLFDDPERMRRGMRRYPVADPAELASIENELTPAEQEIAKTVCPEQLVLEGLSDIELVDPEHRELGWKKKT